MYCLLHRYTLSVGGGTAAPLLVIACEILLVLLTVLLFPSPARAQLDGISELGHSYQSDARGGCEVAIGDTALAHVRQPASVVLQPQGKFDSKITTIFPINHWSDLSSGAYSTFNLALSHNLGAVYPLGEKSAVGLAWETGGWSTRFKNGYVQFPGSTETSFDLKKSSIYANYGYKVTDKWFVGAGPHIEIVKFSTDLVVGSGVLKWPSSYSVGGGFQAGTLYRLTEKLQLGASYASSAYMKAMIAHNATYSVPGIGRFTGPLSIKPYSMPGRVSFGVSYSATEKMKLATEAGYLNYRNSLWGKTRIGGLINTSFDPGFKDIWVINNGCDYDFTRHWSGSIGYAWNSNPIDRNQMVPSFVSNSQNMFTWGLRYRRGRWWTGFAHIIGLPAVTRSTPETHLAMGVDYQHSAVRQLLQSFNCGVGFAF
jgi:long-subunit fatty acid transport protein